MRPATRVFCCCHAKRYTVLYTPPMKHPGTCVRRLLRLQQELHNQSRFYLSAVLQTIGWHCNRRCARRAGLIYWDYHRLVPFVWGRRGRPARDRGSCHATDTCTICENSRHGVADLDTGKSGTRTASVSWVGTQLNSFLTTNSFSHKISTTKPWTRSCLLVTCFLIKRECFRTFCFYKDYENRLFHRSSWPGFTIDGIRR